jgi:uncharacterized protein (TIGR03084 family)
VTSPIEQLCDDLGDERRDLNELLAPLDAEQWQQPTPAEGWAVLDQVTHLAWFDEAARTSIVDPDTFRADRAGAVGDITGFVEAIATSHRHLEGEAARNWLQQSGAALVAAARARNGSDRVPWYGPDMTIASCITARIMETWAHGQDIADAVGVVRVATGRLRHVAFIGVRAFANSFRARELEVPAISLRVCLTAPDGETWVFGSDDDSELVQTVTGPALDFCLLVTQRRHRADTTLVASGAAADRWLDIAQAFAGPPGSGRAPRDDGRSAR